MKQKILKYLLTFLGILSLGLGLLGIILPILPTTPFLLLTAFLFAKGSKRLNHWLLNHKILGEYIYNYKTYHAIKRRVKIYALALLWVSISISIFLVDIILIRALLLIVAIAVTVHISSIKTLENI